MSAKGRRESYITMILMKLKSAMIMELMQADKTTVI